LRRERTNQPPRYSCSENELREIFNRFGQVQTCIVNKDKRHAFVKMYYRKDAERAKTAMEEMRNQEFQLRVSPLLPLCSHQPSNPSLTTHA
jgi:RNA recognition motif-containing protein